MYLRRGSMSRLYLSFVRVSRSLGFSSCVCFTSLSILKECYQTHGSISLSLSESYFTDSMP